MHSLHTMSWKDPALCVFRSASHRLLTRIIRTATLVTCETVSRKVLGKSWYLVLHIRCSHLCHLNTFRLWRDQVSAPTAGPQVWVERTSHTCMQEKKTKKQGYSTPQCVIYTSVQTGCGRIEGVPWGRFSSAPLSLPSCPHPLCRRRNRHLSGPVQGRRSASYITTLLSWGCAAGL